MDRNERSSFSPATMAVAAWSPLFWLNPPQESQPQTQSKCSHAESFAIAAHLPVQAVLHTGNQLQHAGARAAAEMVALAGKRSRAWLNHATAFTKFRTPHEIMALQQAFWQGATLDYLEAQQRIAAAWGVAVAAPAVADGTARDRLALDDRRDTWPGNGAVSAKRQSPDQRSAA